ncbi:MAG TPA: alpha/beta hydrolase [Steroidobacteraceae bacterium]|nr:alpha/beta hydrolase [Steroidobacteraceae bacterium]
MSFIPLSHLIATPLFGEALLPAQPVAGLVIVHGISEHSGRYRAAMTSFAAQGIACFAYDQRGHGRSPGERADIERFGQFSEDLHEVVQGVAAARAGLPLFLWAHSMGALVTLDAGARIAGQVRGIATSGCPIAAYARAAPFLMPPLRFVSRLAPHARVSSFLGVKELSHDTAVQRAYVEDPLVERSVTLRLLEGVATACGTGRTAARELHMPWLAMHGSEDRIAPPQGSRDLMSLLASQDKQLVIYPGQRHEVHNELEPARSQFLGTLAQWVRERCAR